MPARGGTGRLGRGQTTQLDCRSVDRHQAFLDGVVHRKGVPLLPAPPTDPGQRQQQRSDDCGQDEGIQWQDRPDLTLSGATATHHGSTAHEGVR